MLGACSKTFRNNAGGLNFSLNTSVFTQDGVRVLTKSVFWHIFIVKSPYLGLFCGNRFKILGENTKNPYN